MLTIAPCKNEVKFESFRLIEFEAYFGWFGGETRETGGYQHKLLIFSIIFEDLQRIADLVNNLSWKRNRDSFGHGIF